MADAHGSGPCVSNNMRVQVPSPALSGFKKVLKKLKLPLDKMTK